MRTIFIYIFLIICSSQILGQNYDLSFLDCDSSRDTTLPLKGKLIDSSEVSKIQFVSFMHGPYLKYDGDIYYYPNKYTRKASGLKEKEVKNFDISNLTIDNSKLIELKTITDTITKSSLFEVFNYKYIPERMYTTSGGALCYYPRNAIIFYGSKDEIIQIFEVCFECTHYSVYGSGFPHICEEDFRVIYELFKTEGIQYGITEK